MYVSPLPLAVNDEEGYSSDIHGLVGSGIGLESRYRLPN
ncbi:hypothetical protein IYC_14073 [Clostridium sporogenes PA 3679]|nr:hypothetical protein IYC_14073 [Clostridium sporogenes PA 3679]